MLEAILRRFDADPEICVLATAADGPQLVAEFERHRPDVVLADYWLPGFTGARATRRIRRFDPNARVVVFSASDDPEVIAAAADSGAVAFVPKSAGGHELVARVRDAARCPSVPTDRSGRPSPDSKRGELTRREEQVLRLLADGHTNRSIAGQLDLSPETVKTHVRRVYDKLGVRDRPSAVRVALREGLID